MKPYKSIKIKNNDWWLKHRQSGIGGSDAGTVFGLNKYKSPYTLWCEKTHKFEVEPIENEHIRIGNDLEDYVAKRFQEATNKKVKKSSFCYQSIDDPFMLATIDRWVLGENAGLECKTTSALNSSKYSEDDFNNMNYYLQCMHYMAVTGADHWYLAVLVLSEGFYVYKIERNEEQIQTLIEVEKDFWNHVVNDEPVVIDSSDSTRRSIDKQYMNENQSAVQLSKYDVSKIEEIDELNQSIAVLDNRKKELINLLKASLEDNAIGLSGKKIVKNVTRKRKSVDTKALKAKYPDIYTEFLKETEYKTFSISDAKEEKGE